MCLKFVTKIKVIQTVQHAILPFPVNTLQKFCRDLKFLPVVQFSQYGEDDYLSLANEGYS